MALKDSLSKLDRALDRRLEDLPDISSKADRERYRGAVRSGVTTAGRRASVTLKNLDDLGDKAVGRLRPRKGGWDRMIDWSTANPFLTIIICFIIAGAIGSQEEIVMKQIRWYFFFTIALVALSAVFYLIQIAIFHKTEDTFFYMLQDIAFVPVQVLLVRDSFPEPVAHHAGEEGTAQEVEHAHRHVLH